MSTLKGHYFDGKRPIAVPAKIQLIDDQVKLKSDLFSEQIALSQLRVSPAIGTAKRFINLPNSGQFVCDNSEILHSIPQKSQSEGVVAWLEEKWGIALACVITIAGLLITGYFYGLPIAAKHVANYIPMGTEKTLGQEAISWLDEKQWFNPSKLDLQKQKEITEGFIKLSDGLPVQPFLQLEFRSGQFFGANALALPGGIIVITDEMVQAAVTLEEILTVLAHEIGHIELRHVTRSVLQNSVIGITVAALTADAATLSAVVTGLPVLIARTKYSRLFETEADQYAFELIKKRGYSPNAFAALMERLSKNKNNSRGPLTWFSTHPGTAERVEHARQSAN